MSMVRRLLKRLYYLAPVQAARSAWRALGRKGRAETRIADLVGSLRAAGIREGDLILVHASLRGLGNVTGGAASVLDAVLQAVGREGTVLMPAHPVTSYPRQRLREEVFVVSETPSNTGAIAEEMRRRDGCIRSAHPTHSVIGVGPRARELLALHHMDPTPFGAHSPYRLLADSGGKVVGLGLDIRYFTIYHVVEEDPGYPFDVYLNEPVEARIRIGDEPALTVSTRVHDPAISAARLDSWKERRDKIFRALLTHGNLHHSECNGAQVNVIAAASVLRVLRHLLQENETIYEPSKIRRPE